MTLYTLKKRLAESSNWLDKHMPTIFGGRTLPAVILVMLYFILLTGAVFGAQQGYEAQSLDDTIMYVSGDQIVTGEQAEPIGYEGAGLLYHFVGVILYASFHIALTAGSLMAMFTYATSNIVPSVFWKYFFELSPIPGFILIAWAIGMDLQSAAQFAKTRIQ